MKPITNPKICLLAASELQPYTHQYNTLKEILTLISFKGFASNRGKMQAVIAGSYPTFLVGKVKKYNDIFAMG